MSMSIEKSSSFQPDANHQSKTKSDRHNLQAKKQLKEAKRPALEQAKLDKQKRQSNPRSEDLEKSLKNLLINSTPYKQPSNPATKTTKSRKSSTNTQSNINQSTTLNHFPIQDILNQSPELTHKKSRKNSSATSHSRVSSDHSVTNHQLLFSPSYFNSRESKHKNDLDLVQLIEKSGEFNFEKSISVSKSYSGGSSSQNLKHRDRRNSRNHQPQQHSSQNRLEHGERRKKSSTFNPEISSKLLLTRNLSTNSELSAQISLELLNNKPEPATKGPKLELDMLEDIESIDQDFTNLEYHDGDELFNKLYGTKKQSDQQSLTSSSSSQNSSSKSISSDNVSELSKSVSQRTSRHSGQNSFSRREISGFQPKNSAKINRELLKQVLITLIENDDQFFDKIFNDYCLRVGNSRELRKFLY